MRRNLKTVILALVCLIALSANVFSILLFAESKAKSNTPDESEVLRERAVVAENENLCMTIDSVGHFSLQNKSNGYVWYSCPQDILDSNKTIGVNRQNFQSEIVVDYVYKDTYGNTSSYEKMSVPSFDAVSNNAVKVYKIKDGAKVVYDFYSICASISVEYRIDGSRFYAKISGDGIIEDKEFRAKVKDTASEDQLSMIQESYIVSIWILPAFGAGNSKNKGFVFVPDGCGAYMDYSPVSYTAENTNIPVYGKEVTIEKSYSGTGSVIRQPKAYFPMFAISANDNGIVGVISEGEAISSVNAYKTSRVNAYTGVSPQIDYRTVDRTMIGTRTVQHVSHIETFPDAQIDYHIFDSALSFTGIANNYRQILLSKNKLNKAEDNSGISLSVIGAVDIDSHYFGIPGKKVIALTKYSQVSKIIDDFKKKSVGNVSVNYVGWNNNGVQNKKITNSAKPLGILGGKNDFGKLLSKAGTGGVSVYLDADLQTFKTGGNGLSKLSSSAKTVFDKPYIKKKYSYSTFIEESTDIMLITNKDFKKVFSKYMESVNELNVDIGLSFNSASGTLYSDFDSEKPTSRLELLSLYQKSFSGVKQNLSANDAFSYMWEFADRIFEAPSVSSRQRIYDGEIPMYQMIVRGFIPVTSPAINSSPNRREVFLRAVETGSEPCFTVMYKDSEIVSGTDYDYLYGTTYNQVFDGAVDMYNEYSALLKSISGSQIKNYEFLNSGVRKTTYSNGVVVYVNYNDADYSINEGQTVPAKGFCYQEK